MGTQEDVVGGSHQIPVPPEASRGRRSTAEVRTTLKFLLDCSLFSAFDGAFRKEILEATQSDSPHQTEVLTLLKGGFFGKFEWVGKNGDQLKEGRQIFMRKKAFTDSEEQLQLPALFPFAYDKQPQEPKQARVLCPRHACYANSYRTLAPKTKHVDWHGKVKVWVFKGVLSQSGGLVYRFVPDPESSKLMEEFAIDSGFLAVTGCNDSNYSSKGGKHQLYSEFGPPSQAGAADAGSLLRHHASFSTSITEEVESSAAASSVAPSEAAKRGRGKPNVEQTWGFKNPTEMYAKADRYHIFLLNERQTPIPPHLRSTVEGMGQIQAPRELNPRWILGVYRHLVSE
uniref:Uncharacterized protein n=1 Tax=Chromera velia CCMP2878 TaxID=1169474 RepID=A0A0G4G1R9_9ALVE|eukprot:Cvel_19850.t1-p1 / transcript=Cvel_19850.t1 / gene=Cvel_19850 / organism=Chromera_velia_CCMP2878 / gene_product=hypothetical protein / transcript_product=hypothetical protein / location=Cvel_scaffold1738:19681-21259(+) / protein_length=341 / sequence_SO=supercontig / SO=protein_coding / is_pseudo=false